MINSKIFFYLAGYVAKRNFGVSSRSGSIIERDKLLNPDYHNLEQALIDRQRASHSQIGKKKNLIFLRIRSFQLGINNRMMSSVNWIITSTFFFWFMMWTIHGFRMMMLIYERENCFTRNNVRYINRWIFFNRGPPFKF